MYRDLEFGPIHAVLDVYPRCAGEFWPDGYLQIEVGGRILVSLWSPQHWAVRWNPYGFQYGFEFGPFEIRYGRTA